MSFGYSPVATPPLNTQSPSIGQAPLCKNNANPPVDVANTACLVFNSRGIPIDSTGSPYGNDAIYVTDGSAVYGITVAATGFIRMTMPALAFSRAPDSLSLASVFSRPPSSTHAGISADAMLVLDAV